MLPYWRPTCISHMGGIDMKFALLLACAALVPVASVTAWGADSQDHAKQFDNSATVLSEILTAGDQSIPEDLLKKATCVGVIPNLKRVGFVIGAKYGKGVVTCRLANSTGWSAPSITRIEGGNIGLQIGAGETDV